VCVFCSSLIPRTWSIHDRMDTVTVDFRWAQTGNKFLFFSSPSVVHLGVVEWASIV
jgi:hypothetical protein